MDKIEALRSEGKTRRQSHVGRRQSLTSSHVEQMKETLKERAAKYKEHAGEHLNTQQQMLISTLENGVASQFQAFYRVRGLKYSSGPFVRLLKIIGHIMYLCRAKVGTLLEPKFPAKSSHKHYFT